MGLWDLLFRWKVVNDLNRDDLTDEDELMDMMYVVEDIQKNEELEKNKNKKDDKW